MYTSGNNSLGSVEVHRDPERRPWLLLPNTNLFSSAVQSCHSGLTINSTQLNSTHKEKGAAGLNTSAYVVNTYKRQSRLRTNEMLDNVTT